MRFIIGMLCVLAAPAMADPPPGVDPDTPLHWWFTRQTSVFGSNCCGEGDGHILEDGEWRTHGLDYEVRIDGVWYLVKPFMFLQRTQVDPNPTGRAVVWYTRMLDGVLHIICFAPGTGS